MFYESLRSDLFPMDVSKVIPWHCLRFDLCDSRSFDHEYTSVKEVLITALLICDQVFKNKTFA